MTSDEVIVVDPDDILALATIEYLARNDFTDIRQVGSCLIRAKDGTREVFVCVDSSPAGWLFVPHIFVRAAAREHARIDIIKIFRMADGTTGIKHMMNIVEAT